MLYILSVLAAQLAFVGITPVVVAPSLTFLASKASILLTTVTAICASEFLRHFSTPTNGCQVSPGRPVGSTRPLGVGLALDLAGARIAGYQVIQLVSALFACYLLAQAY